MVLLSGSYTLKEGAGVTMKMNVYKEAKLASAHQNHGNLLMS